MSGENRTIFSSLPYVLLILFPLLLVNAGWEKLREWDFQREVGKRQEQSGQILDSLARNWSFPDQLRLKCGEFHRRLEETFLLTASSSRHLPVLIPSMSKGIFAAPFPAHELYVFRTPGGSETGDSQLVHASAPGIQGKRPLEKAFQFMVSTALLGNAGTGLQNPPRRLSQSKSENKTGSQVILGLFGPAVQPATLAQSQVGVPTRVLYRHRPYYFLWNYIQVKGVLHGGYFLFIPEGPETLTSGMRLALKAGVSEKRDFPWLIGKGFIKYFHNEVGDVLSKSLRGSRTFLTWRRNFRKRRLSTLERLRLSSFTVSLPKGVIGFQMLPGFSHLAVIMGVPPQLPGKPGWLFLLNMLVFGVLMVILVNRWFYGVWPRLTISWRFAGIFFLAVAVPLMLGFIASTAYLEENRSAMLRNLQQELLGELMSIDFGKSRFHTTYRNSLYKAIRNPEILEALTSKGLAAPGILDKIRREFRTGAGELPLKTLYLADAGGTVIPRTLDEIGKGGERGNKFFLTAMIRWLWAVEQLQGKTGTKNPLGESDQAFLSMYESACNIDLDEMMATFRGVSTSNGRENTIKIHEFINIKGFDRFGIFVSWQNQDLEKSILAEVGEKCFGKHLGAQFMVFRNVHGVPEPVFSIQRNVDPALLAAIRDRLDTPGTSVFNDEVRETLTVIVPSRHRDKSIYMLQVPTGEIQRQIERKRFLLASLMAFSVAAALELLFWSTGRIVTPIREMDQALAGIEQGSLAQRVRTERHDEIGLLWDAFYDMIEGLKKRQRLVGLVSHQALDNLSRDKAKGISSQVDLNSVASGRRCVAVILFSDIRSFTTLSESKPVHEITQLLNRHFEEMSLAVHRFGGRIDKFIGDAVQTIFEEVDAGENASTRALRAGLEMLQKHQKINLERETQGLFPYRIGVGIDRGEVFLGGIGEIDIRFDYAVIGMPVKEAAYLESLSKQVPDLPLVMAPDVALQVLATEGQSSLREQAREVGPESARDGKVLKGVPVFADDLVPLSGHEERARIFSPALHMDLLKGPFDLRPSAGQSAIPGEQNDG